MNRQTLRIAAMVIVLMVAARWVVARVPALSPLRGVI